MALCGTVITLVLLDEEPDVSTGDEIPAGDVVARAVRRFETAEEGERQIHNAAWSARDALRRHARKLSSAASG